MANTGSAQRTTTICQPSVEDFVAHHDERSRMSLMRYAEIMWPMKTNESSGGYGEASLFPVEYCTKGNES